MRVILGLLGIALQRQRQDLANEREEGDGIFRGLLFEVLLTALGLGTSCGIKPRSTTRAIRDAVFELFNLGMMIVVSVVGS